MADLIDREKVIEAIDDISVEIDEGYGFQYEKWRKYFCELPGVQESNLINVYGLEEEIRCAMCENPMCTDRGCDGGCEYDERLYDTIIKVLNGRINELPSAHPEQELLKDGTLVVKTDFDMTKFDRVNVIQNGTHYGDLFYQDDDTRWYGEWIKDNNAITYDGKPYPVKGCEFCDSYFADNGEQWNYCPVCGAELK